MPVSRLRLRLAAGFALAFGLGLALLAAGALGYLRRESGRRLDARLAAVARGVADAMVREERETPDSSLAFAAHEVRDEWPSPTDRWIILGHDGAVLAATDTTSLVERMARRAASGNDARFTLDHRDEDIEAARLDGAPVSPLRPDTRFRVVAWGSTEAIEQDARLLAAVLAVTAPLLVLFSLGAGYVLASGALRPARDLGTAVAALAPDDLSRRLPNSGAHDEITALADEFNRLLQRLQEAQLRNQQFVREAAHQIRTPLTLILGEADLAQRANPVPPDTTGVPDDARRTVERIRTAAEVMRHRVDDLMLLAEAQAGSRPRLEEVVELDGLALECTDLMRARASTLGRALALGTVQPLAVRGNEQLLREALLELLENGCRHGGATAPVTTEVVAVDGMPAIRVRSALTAERSPDAEGSGLGMQIVRWIAQVHGGRIDVAAQDGQHVATLVLANATTP
ncbi:MAG: HAMP domain-containing sensor histidine kinase [Gemmatimonadaceae bacterium]